MLAMTLCKSVSADDAGAQRMYPMRGHGTLVLQLPSGWKDQIRQAPGAASQEIMLSGFEGTSFVVMITPIFATPATAADFGTPKSIHAMVEKAAQAAAPRSVEGELGIVTIGGGQGPGYYFDATDRAPKPGEFKYMTQGAVGVGEMVCVFTILSDDAKSVVKTKALTMLSEAGWRPGN
jgi:hypothetical protein